MSKKKFYKVQLDAETIVCPLKMDKKEFTLGELAEGYYDNSEKITGGVVAMSGKLCVRPPYQRSYNMSRYDAGIYMIRIMTENGITTQRVSVVK